MLDLIWESHASIDTGSARAAKMTDKTNLEPAIIRRDWVDDLAGVASGVLVTGGGDRLNDVAEIRGVDIVKFLSGWSERYETDISGFRGVVASNLILRCQLSWA